MDKNQLCQMIGVGLNLPAARTLILSDLHLGIEEATISRGILLPRTFLAALREELEPILAKAKPCEVILNGDIQHEFGKVHEREQVTWLVSYLKEKGVEKFAITKGNHDTIITNYLQEQGFPVRRYYVRGGHFICHGDKVFMNNDFKNAKGIIIGHVHPAVTVTDGIRTERYKCYLLGTFQRKQLIIMPSANPFIEGGEDREVYSPYRRKGAYRIFIVIKDAVIEHHPE